MANDDEGDARKAVRVCLRRVRENMVFVMCVRKYKGRVVGV